MNILFDATILATPSSERGLGKFAKEIIINLYDNLKPEDNLYLLNYNGMDYDFTYKDIKKISVYLGPLQKREHNYRDWLFSVEPLEFIGVTSIEETLIKYNIDFFIIYNFDENPFNFVDAIKVRNKCKTKFVLIVADLIPLIFRDKYLDTLEKYTRYYKKGSITSYCDIIFAISESAKNDILKFYNVEKEKIHISYLGNTLRTKGNIDCDVTARLGIKKPYLIYVASDEWRKNIENTIIAFGQSGKDILDNFQLVLVFKIIDANKYYKIIKDNDLVDNVILTDYVSDDELTYLYSNAYASVFSSYYEGFGLPIIEAMNYGLPVIVSNTSSMPEIVGEKGITFNPYDTKDIAEKIKIILSDKKIYNEQKNLSSERMKLFSFDGCAKGMLKDLRAMYESCNLDIASEKEQDSIYVSDFLLDTIKRNYISLFQDKTLSLLRNENVKIKELLYLLLNGSKEQNVSYTNEEIKVLFDASVLEEGYKKHANRSGIFFTVYNILLELLKRDDVKLYLYIKKEREKILSILETIPPKLWHKIEEYDGKRQIDIVFSPCFAIDEKFRKNKYIRYTLLYDALPIIHPEFFGNPRKEDTWNYDIILNASNSDYYFAISECTKKDYLSVCNEMVEDNISVIDLACSDIFYENNDLKILESAKIKYGIPLNKKYIFSLCSIEPRKNLIAAVKAFINFIETNNVKDIVYVIGGGNWDIFYKNFKNAIKDYEDYIIEIGYVDDNDLSVLYSNSVCFMYPSLYEGFGLPVLEAMTCGVPVITSNTSSMPEVAGDSAVLIEPNNIQEISEAILRIYKNKDLANNLREKGLLRAKHFSWEKTVNKIVDEFKTRLEERKSHIKIPFFDKTEKVIFTIVSKNYIGQAITLSESLTSDFRKDYCFKIFVVDMISSKDEIDFIKNILSENIEIIFYSEIRMFYKDINFEDMLFKYDVIEMSTAIKPYIIEYLINTGYEKIIYVDPDIYFYKGLEELDILLNHYDILLTPHVNSPYPDDGKLPDSFTIMKAGIYNCGFIAVKATENVLAMTKFWRDNLYKYCFINFEEHMFTDQVWAEWFPSLFSKVYILRSDAYNVAYWNLHERNITEKNSKWYVNDKELVFFHFSGINPKNYENISKYQTRYTLSNFSDVYRKIFDDYCEKLKNNNFFEYNSIPYYYNYLPSIEKKITQWERRRYYNEIINENKVNPFINSEKNKKILQRYIEGEKIDSSNNVAFGVNLIGYFFEEHSIGHVARLFTNMLLKTGIPFSIQDISTKKSENIMQENSHLKPYIVDDSLYDINIFFVNADQIQYVMNTNKEKYINKYNMSIWFWEYETGFHKYRDSYKNLSEILCFSDFTLKVFKENAGEGCNVRKIKTPLYKDWKIVNDKNTLRNKYNIGKKDFVLFYNFDFNSSYYRKNPEAIIDAFAQSIGKYDDVKLVLKTSNRSGYESIVENFNRIIKEKGIEDKLLWIDSFLSRNDVMELMNMSDVYISLHRGEGLGLGMLEAMMIGKPVVWTAYSGSTEFLNESNSFPVPYKLVKCKDTLEQYSEVTEWAEPDVEYAAKIILNLYLNRNIGIEMGLKGQEYIERYFSREEFIFSIYSLFEDI